MKVTNNIINNILINILQLIYNIEAIYLCKRRNIKTILRIPLIKQHYKNNFQLSHFFKLQHNNVSCLLLIRDFQNKVLHNEMKSV